AEQETVGGVFYWIASPGHSLDDCFLQTRSSVVMVGAPFLWPREDAAGANPVRFRGIHGSILILARSSVRSVADEQHQIVSSPVKMRMCATVSGVGAVLALFAMPGTAIAKGGTFVIKPSRTTELQLKGSNGYSISVIGEGDDEVSLTAKHGGSSATYATRGIASSTRLKARFGNFGLVSMRFHSDSGPRRVPLASGNCRGKGEI